MSAANDLGTGCFERRGKETGCYERRKGRQAAVSAASDVQNGSFERRGPERRCHERRNWRNSLQRDTTRRDSLLRATTVSYTAQAG